MNKTIETLADAYEDAMNVYMVVNLAGELHRETNITAAKLALDAARNALLAALAAPAPQQVPAVDTRVAFEAHWVVTRGSHKAPRQLTRSTTNPDGYIWDSTQRHWSTWQSALSAQAALALQASGEAS